MNKSTGYTISLILLVLLNSMNFMFFVFFVCFIAYMAKKDWWFKLSISSLRFCLVLNGLYIFGALYVGVSEKGKFISQYLKYPPEAIISFSILGLLINIIFLMIFKKIYKKQIIKLN